MADERDDHYDMQDEGEYHFSDEQMNYDMDDLPTSQTPSSAVSSKEGLSQKVSNSRQYVIGGSVFLILIFIVYKMLSPSAPQVPGEITQSKPSKTVVVSTTPPPVPAAQQSPATVISSVTPASPAASVPAPAPAASAPVAAMPMSPTSQVNGNPSGGMPQVAAQSTVPPSSSLQPQSTVVVPATATTTTTTSASPADLKSIMDRLDTLSQQSMKMGYTVGTEYPQKFAAYEEQNTALLTKIQELNGRIAALEASLSQLAQILQTGGAPALKGAALPAASGSAEVPASQGKLATEPKATYSVQAIIPGRAWLKSETGDTITIAEGDALKDFGKVTKIDPYDGVVEVDTGSKVVTLTYGGG